MSINKFRDEYYCLSNFYRRRVVYKGVAFGSSEAAFQSEKGTNLEDIGSFGSLSPWDAKKHGHEIQVREDWEVVKYGIMYEIVKAKFTQNRDLAQILLDTGDEKLEEGNTHGDITWGTVNGEGLNILGIILMKVRKELREM